MITILNFSPRTNGINDKICDMLCDGFTETNVNYQCIKLRELTIHECSNCRSCMKSPGDDVGTCHLTDDMSQFIKSILQSKCIIMSSPINCYDLPSKLQVILERMSIFCHWSDDMYAPKVRLMPHDIKGILITTSAMPGVMVPLVTKARKTFRLFAKPLRVKRITYYHLGFKGRATDMTVTEKDKKTVRCIVEKLAHDAVATA